MEKQAQVFLDKLFHNLKKNNIDLSGLFIDHICYRTSSKESYIKNKDRFSALGECLIESEVGGRLISTYKLYKPIKYKEWTIPLVEVPAPKPKKLTPEGFEHIEVVIGEPFDKFMQIHSNLHFNLKGANKKTNPDIELEFSDCAIKFHHQSLEEVIVQEKLLLKANL